MSRPGLAKREATYEDLMKVSDLKVAEILDGELYASPRPAVPHALAASVLGTEIGGPFQQGRGGPGGWWILDEPELHVGRDVVVPDVAGWRRTRMPAPPSTPAIELAPDWVCEILSPSTEAMDRVPKLRIYAREGVANVWFVNPLTHTLEVLRLSNGAWVVVATHDGDATVNVEPFDAVPLELFRLWGRSAPEP
jgi:Uma2 family endonuclease